MPAFTSFSQLLEPRRDILVAPHGSPACGAWTVKPTTAPVFPVQLGSVQSSRACVPRWGKSWFVAVLRGRIPPDKEKSSRKPGNRGEGSSMERRLQTLSQKDSMRGLPSALESSCWMQHNPRTGKGAVHQLCVRDNSLHSTQAGLRFHP